jgi:hypothetical protein
MAESVVPMARGLRRLLPAAFAVLFLSIPPILFFLHPSSFWAKMDYQPLGLADALNLAYRLADRQMYPARGMMDHPGVPFYFMSWAALALAGYPTASSDPGFFAAVIAQVERYHQISIWLGALVGAAGVYIFARTARNLVPAGVVALGLIVWLVSTPATLLMFASPSIDSFAIVINALFLAVLVRIANDRDVLAGVAAVSASVGAFAYLNKLSYVYVVLALAVTGILNLILRRPGWTRASVLCGLFAVTFVLVIIAVGFAVIGGKGFHDLIEFHKHVFRGSGMYGTGEEVVVSGDAVWRAIAAIPADRAYAVYIALIGGAVIITGGLATSLRGSQHFPAAVIGIGAGLACVLSAAIVLKHYALHYTAGVSATLPAGLVAGYLLMKDWGYRPRAVGAALVVAASLFMAAQTMPSLISVLASRTSTTELAKADREDIRAHLAGEKRVVEFVYKAPFAEFGEGFVVTYGSVPRLTDAYRKSRPNVISSMTVGLIDREVGAYVLDKGYFPTAESIKTASNIALLASKPVTMQDGDRLIELRTTFLLIRR